MKISHNGFGIKLDTDSLSTIKIYGQLKDLYGRIPKTTCLQCPGKKCVEADCCKTFSPPMLLIEFINIMRIIDKLDEDKKQKLYFNCFDSFLNHEYIKPCILLDENNMCMVYESRPFSCRMFGIYDKEEWIERLERISAEMGVEKEKVPFNEQCKGIKLKPKQKIKTINKSTSDFIFKQIHSLDVDLFPEVLKNQALDIVMSSYTYLSFDAHYLLMTIGQEKLDILAKIKIDSMLLKDKDSIVFIEHQKQVKDLLKNIKEEALK